MTTTIAKSQLNIVMGAMTFGAEGQEGARVHDVEDVKRILDVFHSHGHDEIDTSRRYSGGTSEEFLGKCDIHKWKIETKLYPFPKRSVDPITHSPEDLRKHLMLSKKALNCEQLEIWYLHAPDRTTPFEETLRGINELYKEGHFKRFGISKFMSYGMGSSRNGLYLQKERLRVATNRISRSVEAELLPCLRKFGISYYAYNPLCGGFLTDRYIGMNDSVEEGSRFDGQKNQGKNYRNRYWNEPHFEALTSIRSIASSHKLTVAEVALRWMSHHSALRRDAGDSVIIGASSVKHIEQNLLDFEKGPLPEAVLKVLDEAWISVKPLAINYWL